MQHFKKLLVRLQTFTLNKLPSNEIKGDPCLAESGLIIYDISNQTDLSEFRFELDKLIDLAIVDLLSLDDKRIKLVLEELNNIKERFDAFWVTHRLHYVGDAFPEYHSKLLYLNNFVYYIGLPYIGFVKNICPFNTELLITGKFVDDLRNSVKLRELYLNELIKQASYLATPAEEATEVPTEKPEKQCNRISNTPVFNDGIAEKFFELIKSYFSPYDQQHLLSLLKENEAPTFPLLFRGNGNQLVDAFKQVYEANLIVGCQKGELEEWIGANFEYVYRNQQKSFHANYLNAIISSNSKPCQSPILDVKKQADGKFIIVPVLRTKRNYSSER